MPCIVDVDIVVLRLTRVHLIRFDLNMILSTGDRQSIRWEPRFERYCLIYNWISLRNFRFRRQFSIHQHENNQFCTGRMSIQSSIDMICWTVTWHLDCPFSFHRRRKIEKRLRNRFIGGRCVWIVFVILAVWPLDRICVLNVTNLT